MTHPLRYLSSLLLWLLPLAYSLAQAPVDSTTVSMPVIDISEDSAKVSPESFEYFREEPDESTLPDLAQEPEEKKQERDTIDYPIISALNIYFDYPKLFSFFTEYENKAEVGIQLQLLKHFLLGVELGRGRITPINFYKNADYEVSGNYARIGVGYTKALGAKSRINLGVNYGSSFFNDKANIRIESPSGLFNSLNETIERKSLKGNWFELTIGTESHLGKNLYLGFIGRLRILNDYDSFEELDVFAIPGYGRTFDSSIPAINMYIKYRIPFY